MTEKRRHRGPLGRMIAFLYYHLDLYGHDGRPSHTKVLTTFGFFTTLLAETWWLVYLSTQADGVQDLKDVITWPYVFLVVMTLALAMGRDTFKAALRMRTGNVTPVTTTPKRDEVV